MTFAPPAVPAFSPPDPSETHLWPGRGHWHVGEYLGWPDDSAGEWSGREGLCFPTYASACFAYARMQRLTALREQGMLPS